MERPTKRRLGEPPTWVSTSSDGIDRLSLFPDDILGHILSFLDIFDQLNSSLLSKRWRYLWTKAPNFDINPGWSREIVEYDAIKGFINWALDSRGSSKIARFQIDYAETFKESDILGWFQVITRRNVEEIDLCVFIGPTFELPNCLVTCESLRVLKLSLLPCSLLLPAHQGFRQLETLVLEFVQLTDEDLTRNFISSCPSLRTLKLIDCDVRELKVLHVSSASIRYLTIHDLNCDFDRNKFCSTDIKISCPELLFFRYIGSVARNYFLENFSSLKDSTVCICLRDRPSSPHDEPTLDEDGARLVLKFLHEIQNVKVLKFCKLFLMCLYSVLDELRGCSLALNGLRSIALCIAMEDCYIQTTIFCLRSFRHLQALTFFLEETRCSVFCNIGHWAGKKVDWSKHKCRWSKYQELVDEEITCLKCHCKFVEIIDFKGTEDEIELIRFILKNGLVLEKLIIKWVSRFVIAISPGNLYRNLASVDATKINDIISRLPRSSPTVAVTILGPVQGVDLP